MATNTKHLLHKKSKVVLEDGSPKLPQATDIEHGEIAINYSKDHETISIKNDEGEIVKFSSDKLVNDLKDELIKDEKNISKTFELLVRSIGLNDNFTFSSDREKLQHASCITGAIEKLSDLINNNESIADNGIKVMTQDAYDSITPDKNTIYFIKEND